MGTGSEVAVKNESVILGGGCFWCTESVFLAVRGVQEVVPGYSGGRIDNPSYERVCRGDTGHVEVVRVTFDPDVVSLETVLEIFFATHDPTSLNRQGADEGTQYASVVFYGNLQQKETAEQVMARVAQTLGSKLATRLEPAPQFWPAEGYHHDYYAKHPQQGYCQVVISPKMAKLRKKFAPLLQS